MKWLSLLLIPIVVVANGCGKSESQKDFQERKKIGAEVLASFDTTHKGIIHLAKDPPLFRLVSQPEAENSSPEHMTFRRGWVLELSDQSSSEETRMPLIKALEALGKPYSPTASKKGLNFDFQVEDEGERIRVNIVANWKKEPHNN